MKKLGKKNKNIGVKNVGVKKCKNFGLEKIGGKNIPDKIDH